MKNRKSQSGKDIAINWGSSDQVTNSNLIAHLRSSSAKTVSERSTKPLKSRFLKNSLIERGSSLLKSYNTLAQKSYSSFGNADAFFKKSLRHYDDLELITPRRNSYKKSRPKSEKPKKSTAKEGQRGQGDFEKFLVSLSKTPLATEEEEKEEEEEETFYSPKSTVVDLKLTEMADEEGEDQPNEVPPENPDDGAEQAPEDTAQENEAEDPMQETEVFVSDTDAAIAKMEEEMADAPMNENAVLKEVEECEAQCMEIYKILSELKQRVTELLNKSSRTPEEEQELECKQKLLNDKMALLEQKTRRIELLVGKAKKQDFNKIYDEDTLPKVVVCGLAENNMPKFIICDDKKRRNMTSRKGCSPLLGPNPTCTNAVLPPQPFCGQGGVPRPPTSNIPASMPCPQRNPCIGDDDDLPPVSVNVMPKFAKKLSESYNMQERLAQDNADLEGKRYQLQEDLLCKDQTLETLQRQLQCMQTELRQVVKENCVLNCKLQQIQTCQPNELNPGDQNIANQSKGVCQTPGTSPCGDKVGNQKRGPCGKGKGVCPAEQEEQETKKLEQQLYLMEMEVKAIQNELCTVRQERLHLEQHRRMLATPLPCAPPPCATCMPPCPPPPKPDTQLRELREKYNCLQDDYKSKLMEVSGLRVDVDKLKTHLQETQDAKKAIEEKLKDLEKLMKDTTGGKNAVTKENMMELEQQLNVAKQRFREAQDELDELRALTEEQQSQLCDYRNKYLEAQQQVEEQRRQIDLMELENSRIGEQVNLEIQRVKNQFQEKLQELTPLPDILKATQLKLQEAQQMHLMAERNNEALLREIQNLRDKAVMAVEQMEANKSDQALMGAERQNVMVRNDELEKQVEILNNDNDDLRKDMERMREEVEDAEKRAEEKLHEIAQLNAEVDNVREESARQVARTKDRCETIRRSMQNQICDLEKQLAQSRAQAKAAQRDRDDIRQKMQSQINNLNENFEDAQMRIRTLQGHVNFLKNSAAVYPSLDQLPPARNC